MDNSDKRSNSDSSNPANKRPKFSNQKPQEPLSESKRQVLDTFQHYRDTLDSHYDRRERVIKTSRDITALSKKMVFSLLRITQDDPQKVFTDVENKNKGVIELFRKVSADLQGSDAFRYNRQITPGIQEYIEALGLWTFLKDDRLVSKSEVEERLASLVEITDTDYILGISDLPGEVNRYCINSIGKGDHEAVKRCLGFLRMLKEGINLVLCSGRVRDLAKKVPVLDSSLGKIEAAYFSMSIRESEFGKSTSSNVVSAVATAVADAN